MAVAREPGVTSLTWVEQWTIHAGVMTSDTPLPRDMAKTDQMDWDCLNTYQSKSSRNNYEYLIVHSPCPLSIGQILSKYLSDQLGTM